MSCWLWAYVFWWMLAFCAGRWPVILTQTHGCLRASCAVILLAGLMVNIWLMRFLASGVTVSHSGEGNYRKHRSMVIFWLHKLYCMIETKGDSRHKPRLWSADRACAGLHPKMEDTPPAEYTGWLLQWHYGYFTSTRFYAFLEIIL